jgi:hypothetical protein
MIVLSVREGPVGSSGGTLRVELFIGRSYPRPVSY